jgi:hypothetical protein
MKSIKNQYIALKEGKMTEAQFMRNVRMSLPQYISNVTLFKQAEKILINKGIISEIKDTIVEDKDKSSNIQKLIDAGYSESDAEDLADEFEQGGVKVPQKVKDILKEINTDGLKQMGYSDSDIEDFMDEWKQGGSKLPEKVRDYLDGLYNTRLGQLKTKSLREAKDTSATGYYNQDGKEQYGKFDELDNMNAQEIMAGYVLEKIDNPDKDKMEICKLVIKNLKKDQFYYTNYKLTGVRDQQPTEFTSTKRKPGFDQAEEVSKKADNLKDTKNATTIVKEGLSEVATDEKLDEAQKSKLKMAIRKVMKEMFDGMEPLSRTGLDENAKALKNLEVGDVFRVVKEKVAGVRENTNYEITMLGNYLLDFKTVKNPEHAALGQTGTMSVDRFKENVLSGDIIIYPK